MPRKKGPYKKYLDRSYSDKSVPRTSEIRRKKLKENPADASTSHDHPATLLDVDNPIDMHAVGDALNFVPHPPLTASFEEIGSPVAAPDADNLIDTRTEGEVSNSAPSTALSDEFDSELEVSSSENESETGEPQAPDENCLTADPMLCQKIPGSNLMKFDCLFMILNFAMRFSLSNIGIISLITLINIILGTQVIPPSMHFFRKTFKPSQTCEFHFYCSKCCMYFGTAKECEERVKSPEKFKQCPECETSFSLAGMNYGHFFITISIGEQMKEILETEDGNSFINYRKNRMSDPEIIRDIFDCNLFKDLAVNAELKDCDLTINMNTDGTPIFKSGKKSLWPIQFRMNEQSPRERFSNDNMLVTGLWFGKEEPNMSTFLTPMVREMQSLSEDGITWYNKITKSLVKSRVFLLNFILDAPAKCKVLNMRQHNGRYSCNLCYQKGDNVPPGGKLIRYPFSKTEKERTDSSIRKDMKRSKKAGAKKISFGMKGLSALMFIPFFNLTYGVTIDFMHSRLLGLTEHLFRNLWTNTVLHREDFYLNKDKISCINSRLLSLRTPSNISRDPRPLTQAADFKANEWRSFLFFYGPIILHDILPKKYYDHFCALSSAIFYLCQKEIKRSDLQLINEKLTYFNEKFEELYGAAHATYNFHMNSHILKSVLMTGPLWATSAFPFESGNGILKQLVSGANGVLHQIAYGYLMFSSIPKFLSVFPMISKKTADFCDSIMSYQRLKKFCSIDSTLTIVGNKFQVKLTPADADLPLFLSHVVGVESLFSLKKVIFKRMIFTPKPEKKKNGAEKKKDDSFVKLKSGIFVRIKILFVSVNINNDVFAVVTELKLNKKQASAPQGLHIHHCDPYPFKNESIIVSVHDFESKCFYLRKDNQSFIVESSLCFDKD